MLRAGSGLQRKTLNDQVLLITVAGAASGLKSINYTTELPI